MTPQVAAELISQAASALGYAHAQGVLHRDVKPSNLLLGKDGKIRLADFGLAKILDGEEALTETGDVVGSLRYLAPESFEGVRDQQADVYGLGLTLYELLTLRPAFGQSDKSRLVKQIADGDFRPPRVRDGSIPRDLETITMKAIAREPADRYATAKELNEDLQRFLSGHPILARRTNWLEKAWKWSRRNPSLATVTAALALLLFVCIPVLLLLLQNRELARVRANQGKVQAELREERVAAAAMEAEANARQERARAEGLAQGRAAAEYAFLTNSLHSAIAQGEIGGTVRRMRRYNAAQRKKIRKNPKFADFRDWEWDYLKRQCNQYTREIRPPGRRIISLKLNHDESLLLIVEATERFESSVATQGAVSIFDLATGMERRVIGGVGETIVDADFSPDGSLIATISLQLTAWGEKGSVKLWNAKSGELIRSKALEYEFPIELLQRWKPCTPMVRFAPDGDTVLTTSPVVAYETESLAEIWKQEGEDFLFCANGMIAIYCAGVEFALHDKETGEKVFGRNTKWLPRESYGISQSITGKLLTVLVKSGNQQVWDIRPDGLRYNQSVKLPQSAWGKVNPNGLAIFRSRPDGTIAIASIDGKTPTRFSAGHRANVTNGVFTSDGQKLITSDSMGRILEWELTDREPRWFKVPDMKGSCVEEIAFDASGEIVQYASSNFTQQAGPRGGRFSLQTNRLTRMELETTNFVHWPRHEIRYSHDGKFLAAPIQESTRASNPQELIGFAKGWIGVWAAESNELLAKFNLEDRTITAIAWEPNGARRLVVASELEGNRDTSLTIVDLAAIDDATAPVTLDSDEIQHLPIGNSAISSVAVSSTARLAFGTATGKIGLVSLPDIERSKITYLPRSGLYAIRALDFSPDGQKLAAGHYSGSKVSVFDLDGNKLSYELDASDSVCGVRFSPNGRRLLVVDQHSILIVIDAVNGYRLLTLDGRSEIRRASPGASVRAIFSPDGKLIGTNSLDGRISIWGE